MANIKPFLERNNIYFQVVAATLLSLMSLFVGYMGFRVSSEQLDLAEKDHMPLINAREERGVDSSATQRYRIITVENNGWHVEELHSELHSYIQLSLGGIGNQIVYQIAGTVKKKFVTGNTQGVIAKYIIPIDSISEQAYSPEPCCLPYGNSNDTLLQSRILEIRYRDFRHRPHVKYYQLHPLFGVIPIASLATASPARKGKLHRTIHARDLNVSRLQKMARADLLGKLERK